MSNKEYLGDSVYAELTGHMVLLTTENGLPHDPSNSIYLEPSVLAALVAYAERAGLIDKRSSDDDR